MVLHKAAHAGSVAELTQSPAHVQLEPSHLRRPASGEGTPGVDLQWSFSFTKVNSDERIVEGWATADVRDLQNDRIPYEVAKRAFEQYFATVGIREMHQPRAVGRLDKWWPDDAGKRIGISCYISKSRDGEDAWIKVQEHVLKGFSIGGRALDWKYASSERIITEMQLTEISLVDVPANPMAQITLYKVDAAQLAAPQGRDAMPVLEPTAQTNAISAMVAAATDPNAPAATVAKMTDIAAPDKAPPIAQVPALERDPEQVDITNKANPVTQRPVGVVEVPVQVHLDNFGRDGTKPPATVAPTLNTAPMELPPHMLLTKDVGTAPNLREADGNAQARCGNCAFFRYLDDGYCRLHDFATRYQWVCDSWNLEGTPGNNEPPAVMHVAVPANGDPASAPESHDPSMSPSSTSGESVQYDADGGDGGDGGSDASSDDSDIVAAANVASDSTSNGAIDKRLDQCPHCKAFIKAVSWGMYQCSFCLGTYEVVPAADGPAPKFARSLAKFVPVAVNPQVMRDLERKAQRVGIMRKASSPLRAPAGFPSNWMLYADPANFAYPTDRAHAQQSVDAYNSGLNKAQYTPTERAILGRRIARLASSSTDADYVFDALAKTIARNERKAMGTPNLDATLSQVKQSVAAAMEMIGTDPARAKDMLTQVCGAIDVAGDSAGGQGGANHAQVAPQNPAANGQAPQQPANADAPQGNNAPAASGRPLVHVMVDSGGNAVMHPAPDPRPAANPPPAMGADTNKSLLDALSALSTSVTALAADVKLLKQGKDTLPAAAQQPGQDSAVNKALSPAPANDVPPAAPAAPMSDLDKAIMAGDVALATKLAGNYNKVMIRQEEMTKGMIAAAGIGGQKFFIMDTFATGGEVTEKSIMAIQRS